MLRIFTSIVVVALCAFSFAQSQIWQSTPLPAGPPPGSETFRIRQYASFHVNLQALRAELLFAPMEGSRIEGRLVAMPSPDGTTKRFRIFESPIQSPAVQRKTGVRTYMGQGIDDPWATGRFDIGINGFHGMVYSPSGDYFIDPLGTVSSGNYIVFFQRDCDRLLCFKCGVPGDNGTKPKMGPQGGDPPLRPGPNRKEYRLVIKGTGEYTQFFGTVANADANTTTVVNRVNGVYERDIAIRMIIVLIENFPNPATDPYSSNPSLSQNQSSCDANPGNAAYDIGHLFHRGGGGVAVLNSVGVTGQKAMGLSGLPSPVGDPFSIDYVAHEMGHQYGGNHSFNSISGSCSGNRSASHAYEPGSGSTIMAYAGICGAENIQSNSDDYFHVDSQIWIEAWRNNAASGGSTIVTGNNSPVVNAGADFTIPQDTPFRLTGSATDTDGDALSYCWEQFNLGPATPGADESLRPLFRSLKPVASPTRWFPKQSTVLANINDQWENLPSVNRSMTMRCTVRDNRAGGGNYQFDDAIVTVSGAPFSVTAPNTAVNWAGGTSQTVTWNVGGSGGTANVRILLSVDGGNSYYNGTATTILASTPNDGSETITVPNVSTSQARIVIEGVNNIFYDISNVNFTITPGSQWVIPDGYTVITGSEPTHDLAALFTSDDIRLRVNASMAATTVVDVHTISPIATPSRIRFLLECQGNFVDRPRSLSFFNYQTSGWEVVANNAGTLTDSLLIADVTTNASRFVNATTRDMLVRITKMSPTISRTSARVSDLIDQTIWEVFP